MSKKKIKVRLDFNISKKPHSLYNSLLNYPPENVEYLKSDFFGINPTNYSSLGNLRKKLLKFFPFIKRFEKILISILRKESESDLIHFAFHLGKTNKKSVVDYEHAYNFIFNDNKKSEKEKKKAINLLKRGNIKYLLPINNESLKSFNIFFGKEIKIPQKVVYPVIKISEENINNKDKKKKVIFIGSANITSDTAFTIKGGYETTLAFNFLAKKYKDYEFIIVSNIPKDLIKKKEENLIIYSIMDQKDLWNIMKQCQIFVQPNYHTPAMAFLEAMSFKLPIITYDYWANKEYVNEKNGILLKPKSINHINEHNIPEYNDKKLFKIKENSKENSNLIIKAIEDLINNPVKREKMGEEGYKRVKNGKFSLKQRNKILRKIYEEALK